MTGTELVMLGLGGTHIVAALGGWFVGHHGLKAAIAAVQTIPSTVQADVNTLKTDVSVIKTKVGV